MLGGLLAGSGVLPHFPGGIAYIPCSYSGAVALRYACCAPYLQRARPPARRTARRGPPSQELGRTNRNTVEYGENRGQIWGASPVVRAARPGAFSRQRAREEPLGPGLAIPGVSNPAPAQAGSQFSLAIRPARVHPIAGDL